MCTTCIIYVSRHTGRSQQLLQGSTSVSGCQWAHLSLKPAPRRQVQVLRSCVYPKAHELQTPRNSNSGTLRPQQHRLQPDWCGCPTCCSAFNMNTLPPPRDPLTSVCCCSTSRASPAWPRCVLSTLLLRSLSADSALSCLASSSFMYCNRFMRERCADCRFANMRLAFRGSSCVVSRALLRV